MINQRTCRIAARSQADIVPDIGGVDAVIVLSVCLFVADTICQYLCIHCVVTLNVTATRLLCVIVLYLLYRTEMSCKGGARSPVSGGG